MRWSGSVDGRAVEVALLRPIWTEFARQWRDLVVDADGGLSMAGRARSDTVTLLAGRHGRSGARYRLDDRLTVGERSRNTDSPSESGQLTVLADDPRRLTVTVADTVGAVGSVGTVAADTETFALSLDRPSRPRSVSGRTRVPGPGRWPLRGDLDLQAEVDLDALPPARVRGPQVRLTGRHPRLRLSGEARITARPDGGWHLELTIRARGRGLIRPLAALALGPAVRRGVGPKLLAVLPGRLDALHTELVALAGDPPDPGRAATRLLARVLYLTGDENDG